MTNPWDIPSGGFGPAKPYELTVLNPHWAINPQDQFAPTTPQMFLQGRTDDPDWHEFTLQLKTEKKGWNILSSGAELKNDNQRKLSPPGNTSYGRFVLSIIKSDKDELQKLTALLQERGNPTDARIWKGLILVIDEGPVEHIKINEEERDYRPLICAGFKGMIDAGEMTAVDASIEQKQEDLVNNILRIAKEEKKAGHEHSAFANRALSDLNITEPDMIAKVMKESGYWSEVEAEE